MAEWKRLPRQPSLITTRNRGSAKRHKCHTVPHSCLSISGESVQLSERPHRTLRSSSCMLKSSYHVSSSSSTVTFSLDNVAHGTLHSRQREEAYSACSLQKVCSASSLQEADENMRQLSCKHSTPLLRTNASFPSGKTVKASHNTETSPKDNVSNGHDQLRSLRQMESELQQFQLHECKLLLLRCKEELAAIERPKPKWYEMKTPEFHLEAQRQNRVLHNAAKWQRVLEGSNKLLLNEL